MSDVSIMLQRTDQDHRSDLVLSANKVSRRFGRVQALRNVTLTLPRGACSVLVGANGAGKSTLLRLIQGIQSRSSGELAVFGLDPETNGADVRVNIGYVPEDAAFSFRWMTVERLFSHHRAYYSGWDQNYAARLADRLQIQPDRKVSELSKGEGRRVQLLLALAHRPALLLLDEPTDGLDPIVRDDVLALLAEHMADTACSTLVSTHLVHEFQGVADRVAVIKSGVVEVDEDRDALLAGLKTYRGLAPPDWAVPPLLAPRILRAEAFGRERSWTVRGDPDQTRDLLTASGVTLTDAQPLSLEEAVLVLLRSKPSS